MKPPLSGGAKELKFAIVQLYTFFVIVTPLAYLPPATGSSERRSLRVSSSFGKLHNKGTWNASSRVANKLFYL